MHLLRTIGHRELRMNGRDAAKYFVHGIAFSFLFAILTSAWSGIALVFIFLIVSIGFDIGYFIGIIIGLGVLFLVIGGLNTFITSTLWFKVKKGFLDLLSHGVVLFVILLIVNFAIQTLPKQAQPGTPTTVITFLIAAFVDGLIAKKVARWWRAHAWEEEYKMDVSQAVEAEWRDKQL